MKYVTYIGSQTSKDQKNGIHICESDSETGDFKLIEKLDVLENPIYMALSKDCSRLYCVFSDPKIGSGSCNGGIAAFKADGAKLEKMNSVFTARSVPCHVSLSIDEKRLLFAEYSKGTAGIVNLNRDGSIDDTSLRLVEHFGDGPNKPRQDAAHAHCAIATPDNKYMLVADLGIDYIKAYELEKCGCEMKEANAATIRTVPAGAGPRHMIFHPNGKILYVLFELTNLVSSYRYDGRRFTLIETQSLIPAWYKDFSKASAIKISADGKQLFCSNRGYDSIAVFNLDAVSGHMELLNIAKLDGSFPRDFEFMPGEKFCLIGFEKSNTVKSYAYEKATGKFTEVAKMEGIYRPLYFKFADKKRP
jgi:6-phosphogluconolactonase